MLTILGPGLVGSFLGAAAGAERVVLGPSGRIRAVRADCPAGDRSWSPRAVAQATGPCLVCTRIPHTPWNHVPPDHLLAQNGLGQPGPGMACFMAVDRDPDGVIRCHGATPRLVLAEPGPAWTGVIQAWRAAGLVVEVVADVRPARWEKLILNATVGPLCLATGLTMAAVWNQADLRRLVLAATSEGIRLAAEAGVAVDTALPAIAQAFFAAAGEHRPSVVEDPCELPWITGFLRQCIGERAVLFPALVRIADLVGKALAA